MSEQEMVFLESVKAVRRAGSLQMTIPAEAAKLINLKDGDNVFVLYDILRPGQLIILKPSEVTLSRNIRYNIADEEKTILRILESSKAYLPEGHYVLASGRHSNRYIHVRLALAHADYATLIGQRIADKFRDENVDFVAGFSVGGILLAEAVCSSLKDAQVLLGRIEKGDDPREVRVFFDRAKFDKISKNAKVLMVDDVLTTGGTLLAAIKTLEKNGKHGLAGVAVVVDRSDSPRNPFTNRGIRFVGLIRIGLDTYARSECPQCQQSKPLMDMSDADSDPLSVIKDLPPEYQATMASKFKEVQEMLAAVKEWVS